MLADFGKMDSAQLASLANPTSVKLKVYQGTTLKMENQILDFPTGICALYIDNNIPKTPGWYTKNVFHVRKIEKVQPIYVYCNHLLEGFLKRDLHIYRSFWFLLIEPVFFLQLESYPSKAQWSVFC